MLALALLADVAQPGNNGGCCASTTDPPLLYEFSHACTADAQCNGGLTCIQTATVAEASTCDDAGASFGTCTMACLADADCKEFSEYSMATCTPCNAAGAPRVCSR